MGRVVGIDEVRVEIAFVRRPDGHGRLELTKFHSPPATTAEPNAPATTFGLRPICFAVDDIDDIDDVALVGVVTTDDRTESVDFGHVLDVRKRLSRPLGFRQWRM